MKRRKRNLVLYGLVAVFLLSMIGMAGADETADQNKPLEEQAASVFKDVTAGDSNLIYINYLAKRGISSGYPDGSYHPAEGLTRAQAATLLVKAAGLEAGKDQNSPFKDVAPTHWAAGNIAAAASAGYLKGYPDGTYHPEEKLSRAQGISLVLRLSQQKDSGAELPQLKDMDNSHWAARSAAIALAAGMVGLSADKTQFLPEQEFSRGDLARALAVLLTTDPDLNKETMNGNLAIKNGEVKVNDKPVNKSTEVKAGDIIATAAGAEAQLSYPDGTGMLIKEKTTLEVKETRGLSYIKSDGTPGIGVDWLQVDLKKGQVFGALANNPNIKNEEKKTAQSGSRENLLASLSGIELAAVQDKELPWYQANQQKKVKVKVDMPWGVAAIRGSFWNNTVTDTGCSTSLLEGEAELSAGGQTQTLAPGKSSDVSKANAVPTPPVPMTVVQVNLWVQQVTWIQTVAQEIQANQAAVQTEAVITTVVQQNVQISPVAPVTPVVPLTPAPAPAVPNILVVVNQALVQVQQSAGITNIVQINTSVTGVQPVTPPATTNPVVTIPTTTDSGSSSTVTIPDSNLQAAIRTALNKPTGTITKSDMASLTSLDASGCGITDLTGLQHAKNLTVLYLHHNQISNLSQLANLSNLQELYLGNNHISDISTANWAGKLDLIYLGLGYNAISDISPLASAANLQRLHLEYNNIISISPLSSLSDLNILSLHHNGVSGITPLSGLANLNELYLAYNQISSISGVDWAGITGLNVLHIGSNPLSDISPLAEATSLKELRLLNTPVSNISCLTSLIGLEILDIGNTGVTDLSVLSSLTSLKGLSVYSDYNMNSSANISAIAAKTALEGLDIGQTGINDSNLTTLVAGMSNLKNLGAEDNNITNITPLQSKTSLVFLNLNYNHITDISALSGLTNLESLNFNNNKVSNISALSGLTNLKNLHMGSNLITDLSVLSGHTGVITLSIFDNQVGSSISVIQNMTDMEELYMAATGASDLTSLLADLSKLRVLKAGGNGIGNDQLSFLAGFTELQSLALPYNNISDISALGTMAWLQDLNLENNSISSIGALINLHNLQHLVLNNNLIQDVSPVAGLENLCGLHVGGNRITDISDIAPLATSLTSLSLWDNQVGSSISCIGNMTHLQELYIDSMGLTNLSSIVANMDDLNILHASGNRISDISALQDKNDLQVIQLQNNDIGSISALSGHTHLNSLNINNNHVSNISVVSGLTNLRNLHVGNNGMTDISALANLNRMRTLSLYGNSVGDSVYEIQNMTDMQELYLGNMGLTDISQLVGNMNQLKILHAPNNQISNLSVLADKLGLVELDLDYNQIADISYLSGLTRLKSLTFKENQVTGISSVAGLTNLGSLDFGGNQVEDISYLASLNNLKHLSMWDNPVTGIDTAIEVISDMTGMETLHIDGMGPDGAKLTSLTALDGMSSLKSLWANGNNIGSNISQLSEMPFKSSLEELHLDGNNITNISVVSEFPNLVALSVESNSITDISPVACLVNLGGLNFGDNQVTSLSALANLNGIKNLAIFSNPIADVDNAINVIADMYDMQQLHIDDLGTDNAKLSSLSAISAMDNLSGLTASGNQLTNDDIALLADKQELTEINLDYTEITSISALSGLTGLTSLSFKATGVADISIAAGLHNLEGLDFGGTQVTDITPIAGLDGLKFLSLWDIPVSDISLIADKTEMEDLCIHNTGITDLSTLLANMNNLRKLKAQGNNISDISVLAGKSGLELLELKHNLISDISALVANCNNGGLGRGDEVYLSDNNLSTDDMDDVQILINAGVEGDLEELF